LCIEEGGDIIDVCRGFLHLRKHFGCILVEAVDRACVGEGWDIVNVSVVRLTETVTYYFKSFWKHPLTPSPCLEVVVSLLQESNGIHKLCYKRVTAYTSSVTRE
jgi:hypothetical protein